MGESSGSVDRRVHSYPRSSFIFLLEYAFCRLRTDAAREKIRPGSEGIEEGRTTTTAMTTLQTETLRTNTSRCTKWLLGLAGWLALRSIRTKGPQRLLLRLTYKLRAHRTIQKTHCIVGSKWDYSGRRKTRRCSLQTTSLCSAVRHVGS